MSSRSELDREPGGNRGTEPGRVLDASPAIHLTGLTKTFGTRAGDVEAVRGVDLTVARGEIVALLGPNGAGKTTMLDMIFGFTNPTGGSCRVFGWSPRQAVETGLVGGLLQTGALLPDLAVRETVAMVAGQYADPLPVEEALARAGITRIARRKVSACSGGEQQRLRFALALLCRPELLILDEPTAGMDVSARHAFWDRMRAEAARGRTIVFATHYLAEAEEFAERSVVMHRGRIIADGTVDQVRAMGGTRRVSCVWNFADGDPAHLPGVASAREEHGRLVLRPAAEAGGSDALARQLLTATSATDVLIEQVPLEEAFIDLTGHEDRGSQHATPNTSTDPSAPRHTGSLR